MTARVQELAKACDQCGKDFGRRKLASGRLETLAKFAKRRFCSRDCYRDACAEGLRTVPPGRWTEQPHPLQSARGASDGSSSGRASGSGYPWERQRASSRAAFPGHFSAERQTNLPKPSEETPDWRSLMNSRSLIARNIAEIATQRKAR